MNEVVGFAWIKINATSCKGAENPQDFIGRICPVMEFGVNESVLVLNPKGTALAMFDKEDVFRSFKCGYTQGIVCPPDLDMISQWMYISKCHARKGGYDSIIKGMVISVSLSKGEFTDSFL